MINFTPANIKLWARLGSCGAFGQAALCLPEVNEKTVLLTADLCSFSGLERYKNKFPERFFNVGIAEQNMIGVAAGMANEGFTQFVTTYATFAAMRCADQIKVNMGYMNLAIKLVGLTAGCAVGILGPTHMALEDIAVMRAIPNLTILSPADCTATVKAVLTAAQIPTPVYLRLSGTMNTPIVYSDDFEFEVGKAITLREGKDISLFATGSMVYNALQAAALLARDGIQVKVVDVHTIRPLDMDAVFAACDSKLIASVEEHTSAGGLGSAIAEALSMMPARPRHLIIGTTGPYPHAGDYTYLHKILGLSAEDIAKRLFQAYKEQS